VSSGATLPKSTSRDLIASINCANILRNSRDVTYIGDNSDIAVRTDEYETAVDSAIDSGKMSFGVGNVIGTSRLLENMKNPQV